MIRENREYKDSVFCDLFYSDESAKENLLELYNALFDEELTDPSVIHLVRLEDVLFKSLKNDVAFTVEGKRIILCEHQSTVNANMPVRMLMYIAREYEEMMPADARYSEKLYKLEKPLFYVFYNGTKEQPVETELRLSDAFKDRKKKDGGGLELKVKVINLSLEKKHPLLEKCGTLKEYSKFTEVTRRYAGDEKGLEKAVKICMEEGILRKYLERKGKDVVSMLMAEYDYQKDLEVHCREAEEKGVEKGLRKGIKKGIKKGIEKEKINTLREKRRADAAERKIRELQEEMARLKSAK